jgi:hypothetical protein
VNTRHLQAFIERYVTFSNPDYSFVGALWATATHLFPKPQQDPDTKNWTLPAVPFDAFPYLVITSDTKRSGKTRFSEILSFLCNRPKAVAGATAAAIFRYIETVCPTLINDEAELLAGEGASVMRSVLNVGYRRGQMIPRGDGDTVAEWATYCPKVFVLIGDVYDTLRDRSIVVRMQRAAAVERFVFEKARSEAALLLSQIVAATTKHKDAIAEAYAAHKGLPFLSDRDEEIWLPLFAVCQILAPDRVEELKRVAVDMATEKTAPKRRYVDLADEAEAAADTKEYSERLLRDLLSVFKSGERALHTNDALARLHDVTTGPWRKFRGVGLTAIDLSNLLGRFAGVEPVLIKIGGKKGKVARGYHRVTIEKAAKTL